MKTTLKAKHLKRATTTLRNGGIHFDCSIGKEDRDWWTTFESDDERRTRIIVNPTSPTFAELRSFIEEADKHDKDKEDFSAAPDYGIHGMEAYDTTWKFDKKLRDERQHLIAVAYDGDKPVGYAAWGMSFGPSEDEPAPEKSFDFYVALDLVYIDPRHRGRGFGTDLAAAQAMICSDVLKALSTAMPKDHKIEVFVYADFTSEGGGKIAHSIFDCVEAACEDDPCISELHFQGGL